MRITSAKFIKGIVGTDEILDSDIPQVAFIGRSNVGKSSLINSLTRVKGLARTSSFPGRTTEINLFLINKAFYFLDLPGYGYAKASKEAREHLAKLIYWYLFKSEYQQKKIVLIIDAKVGVTDNDLEMLRELETHDKRVLVLANKVDKIKKSEYEDKLHTLSAIASPHRVIPYSSETHVGVEELTNALLEDGTVDRTPGM